MLIEGLLASGATVTAFDPEAADEGRRRLGERIRYADSAMAALEGADALILVTEWSEFRQVDLDEIARKLKSPVLFDGRNIFDPQRMRNAGITYYGIGIN